MEDETCHYVKMCGGRVAKWALQNLIFSTAQVRLRIITSKCRNLIFCLSILQVFLGSFSYAKASIVLICF